jgi:stage III sporulation protein SpoIIIAA
VIVDTSNEIAGDGDIPHPNRSRPPDPPALQHAVMIEAVRTTCPRSS